MIKPQSTIKTIHCINVSNYNTTIVTDVKIIAYVDADTPSTGLLVVYNENLSRPTSHRWAGSCPFRVSLYAL